MKIQMEIIRQLGFEGVYVDRRGYQDGGASIENEIKKLITTTPKIDPSGKIAYYALGNDDSSAARPPSFEALKFLDMFGVLIEGGKIVSLRPFSFFVDFTRPISPQVKSASGLYKPEAWGTWSQGSTVAIRLKDKLPQEFTVEIISSAYGPNAGASFPVSIDKTTRTFNPTAEFGQSTMHFKIGNPTDLITIGVPHPISPLQLGSSDDPREIGLALERLLVTPAGN
jgi:phosphoglycerol transferase